MGSVAAEDVYGIVDVAVQNVDDGFRDGDVRNVENGQSAEDASLEKVDPIRFVSHLDDEPKRSKERHGRYRNGDVDDRAENGTRYGGAVRHETIHGSIRSFGSHSEKLLKTSQVD